MKTQKGLRADIYKHGNEDSSLWGISSKVKTVTIVGAGIPEIFEPDENAPMVVIVEREIAGEKYLHAEPLVEKRTWFTHGGTFIYSSDSRFPSVYPIGLHDRDMSKEA